MAEHLAISLLLFALLTFGALADRSAYGVKLASKSKSRHRNSKKISQILVVDQSGQYGQFKRLQDAIDSIPLYNQEWVEIRIRAGVYREKVIIQAEKPYISIVGEGKDTTIIQWSDGGGSQTLDYATFQVFANNTVVRDVTFKNTYQQQYMTQAPAAVIEGDKVAFYGCGFIGVQDTLTDLVGRHFFKGCYIEGYVDFIWGYGQSIYHGCTLNITSGPYDDRTYGTGYITAQGSRFSDHDNAGFIFKYCTVVGTSQAYLGRPYQNHATVVFYKSYFSDVVVPQGWSSSNFGHARSIVNEEVQCKGPGAKMSKRVKWGRKLSTKELNHLINPYTSINKDYWIEKQPISRVHS